jgi:hypothetical protein
MEFIKGEAERNRRAGNPWMMRLGTEKKILF